MSTSNESSGFFGSIQGLVMVAAVIFCYYPYKFYSGYRDVVIRALYQDDIWVVEENWRVEDKEHFNFFPPNFQKLHDIPRDKGAFNQYPFLTNKQNPSRKTYLHCHSLDEAVKWALDRGYKRTQISTLTFATEKEDRNKSTKWFLVKRINEDVISILSLVVDYGDSNVYRYPYRTDPENPGFSLNEVPIFETGKTNFNPLDWASTNYIKNRIDEDHNMNTRYWYSGY